ncbi:hypothetical protein MnTg04_00508 [bacterium MnTg04]|nr:hypothetical protein MnTg04_00508 [bacterium MnTg04]
MDAFVTFCDYRLHAEQFGSLGRPVARGAGTVFLAGNDQQRSPFVTVTHGGFVDGQLFAAGLMAGPAALGTGSQLVSQADIGKGAAHHHFVVTAPRPVGIEVCRFHALCPQVIGGRAVARNAARR